MDPIIIEHGYSTFILDIQKIEDHYVDFKVFDVVSWTQDHKPCEKELYLKGTVKWDGCSHITFGDKGYIHLCGKSYWEEHTALMNSVWEKTTNLIKNFNEELAK